MIYLFIALVCIILILIVWVKYFKKIRCGNMICITGGIKTGKTTLSVRQALQLYKAQRVKVHLWNWIFRFLLYPFYCFKTKFRLKSKKELPVLYSNIPLRTKYVAITKDLLERTVKPVPGSVCYICEASLVADSMTYKDADLNEKLLLFNKLWGHSSKGGYLVYDTQSIEDNHYAVKRCLNSYFYIHHAIKIPFFYIMYIREERHSEDSLNNYAEDVENSLKVHIVPKRIWKLFDCYCYSILTDKLPASKEIIDGEKLKDLKARKIPSFKNYKFLNSEVQNEKKGS